MSVFQNTIFSSPIATSTNTFDVSTAPTTEATALAFTWTFDPPVNLLAGEPYYFGVDVNSDPVTGGLLAMRAQNNPGNFNFVPSTGFDATMMNGCGSNLGTDIGKAAEFELIEAVSQPPTFSNLQQFKLDGETTLSGNGITLTDIVVFSADVSDSDGDDVSLEVEVKGILEDFDDVATFTGTEVGSGLTATADGTRIADGGKKWQVRAVDSNGVGSVWIEFDSGGLQDFFIDAVPLFTQVVSDFPSAIETTDWAGDVYGTGNYSDCLPDRTMPFDALTNFATVGTCGCAVAASVMVMRQHDISTNEASVIVTPESLNNWLISPLDPDVEEGYTTHGGVIWDSILAYAKDPTTDDDRLSFTWIEGTLTSRKGRLDALLTQANPQPALLYQDGGGVNVTHFLVAAEKLDNTYAVRDPRWYNTRTLNEAATTSCTTGTCVRDYGDSFTSIRSFKKVTSPVRSNPSIITMLSSPGELLVTDPQGRRVGRDPIAEIDYAEIPDAVYGSEGISDPTSSSPQSATEFTKVLFVPAPVDGEYAVEVIGTGTGSYTLDVAIRSDACGLHTERITGETSVDVQDQYTVTYNTGVPVDCGVEDEVQTTLSTLADTDVRRGDANANFGDQTFMELKSSDKERGLLAFDQRVIEDAVGSGTLTSAVLEIDITETFNNWGPSGRLIGAHRMDQAWGEQDVTWNCSTDADLVNNQKDCSGSTEWDMDVASNWPFVSTATDTFLVTNLMTGSVSFDVTADISDFLAETAVNNGWIVRKGDEGQNGKIHLTSKEGSASPRLVIRYDR